MIPARRTGLRHMHYLSRSWGSECYGDMGVGHEWRDTDVLVKTITTSCLPPLPFYTPADSRRHGEDSVDNVRRRQFT